MSKLNKIEKYKLEDFFYQQLEQNKKISNVDLAKLCNAELTHKGIDDSITNMAIARFRNRQKEAKIAVIKADKRRVQKAVNQDFDIIQSQITLCQKMFDQLNIIEDFPDRTDRHFKHLENTIEKSGNPEWLLESIRNYLTSYKKDFQNYIMELTAVSREIRENNKFMVDIRAKVHDYNLVQEYIKIFVEEFHKENPEACANVLQKLAGNPRLRELAVEQETLLGGK